LDAQPPDEILDDVDEEEKPERVAKSCGRTLADPVVARAAVFPPVSAAPVLASIISKTLQIPP